MKWKDALTKRILMFSSPDFLKRIEEEDSSMLAHMDILKKIKKFLTSFLTALVVTTSIIFFFIRNRK